MNIPQAPVPVLTLYPLLLRFCFTTLALLAGTLAYGQTIATATWTGAASTDWANVLNWTTGVPTSMTDVTIPAAPAGGRFPVISTGTQAVKMLIIEPGATVNQVGGTLLVGGSWANRGLYQAIAGTVQFTGNGNNETTFAAGINNLYHVTVDAGINPQFSNTAGNKIQVAGDFINNNAGLPAQSSNFTLTFNGTGNQNFFNATTSAALGDVVVSKSAGTLHLTSATRLINFTLAAGQVSTGAGNHALSLTGNAVFNGGVFSMNSSAISVAGSWTNGGCSISGQAAAITVSGDYIRHGGTYNAPGSTLTVGGNWINHAGSVIAASSVTLQGTGTVIGGSVATAFPELIITGTILMNNSTSCTGLYLPARSVSSFLTLADGTTLTVNGPVSIDQPDNNARAHELNINAGTLTVNGPVSLGNTNTNTNRISRITVTTGTFNLNGDLIYKSAGTAPATAEVNMSAGAGTMNLAGNIILANGGGTLMPGTASTVNFNGPSVQTINFASNIRYHNITVNNPAGVTPGAAVTAALVTGDIRVQSGLLHNGGFANNGAGGKTFEVANGATFNITGTSGMVTGFGTKVFGPASTVDYSGGGQVVSRETYGHLTLRGSGTKAMPALAMTIAGNFTTAGTASATAQNTLAIGGHVALGLGSSFNAGSFTHSVMGNWVNNGAAFTPSTSTIVLNGAADQTLGGTVPTLTYHNLSVNKSFGTVVLATNITVNATLTFTKGIIQTGNQTVILPVTASVSGAGQSSGWVDGRLQKSYGTGNQSRTFEVGGSDYYTPVTVNLASVTTAGSLLVRAATPDHPNISSSGINPGRSVNRYYAITNNGIVFTTANATFNWVAADVDAGATTAKFLIRRFASGAWSVVTSAAPAPTAILAVGLTAFGDFTIGQSVRTTWTGAVSTNWGADGNWSEGLPFALSEVIIPSGLTLYPVLSSGTAAVKDMTIQAGAALTVEGATLQIGGTLVSGGTFIAGKGTVAFVGAAAQVIPAGAFAGNTLKSLVVNNPGGVALNGPLLLTDVLTITNGSLATGGFLTLTSTATGTARVAPITSAAAVPINGAVKVERYVMGRRKYRLMTSPVTTSEAAVLSGGQESLSIWGNWQQAGNNDAANQGTLITGGSSGDGFDQHTTNPSLFTYDAVNRRYVAFSSANGKNTKFTPLKAGTAYFMFVYGDRLNRVNAASPNHTVLAATGRLVTGDQVYTAASATPLSPVTGRYTLLGNPFASPINWATMAKSDLENTIWGWDPNLSSTGGYITVNTTGAVTLIAPYAGSTGLNQYIQSGQGFFVRTAGPAPTLTIREQDKADHNNTSAFRTATTEAMPLVAVNLLYSQAGTSVLADGVVAAFEAGYAKGLGREDAAKMANAGESVGWRHGADLLSIDARPMPQPADTLFLNMVRLTRAQYTLQVVARNLEDSQVQPYLYDRHLKALQALSFTDANHIALAVDAAADANRFCIVFRSRSAPGAFTTLAAVKTERGAQLNWGLAAATGGQKHLVESSTDGIRFLTRTEVSAEDLNSPQTYSWTDATPAGGVNYYRIRTLLADGTTLISQVVQVTMEAVKPEIKVFPNPIKGRQVQVLLDKLPAGDYQVSLVNAQGQQVVKRALHHDGGTAAQTFYLPQDVAAGVYVLRVENKNAGYSQLVMIQ